MSSPGVGGDQAGLGIGALDLFVEVLSQSEAGSRTDGFYDRLCEAVCQLASMRRAVIFRYDSAGRRVRAVGAYGMSIAPFADAHVTVESAPIAAEALRTDSVVEAVGDMRRQTPAEFAGILAEPARLVCAPMAAGGRMIGVILTDRLMSEPELQDSDRRLLWTLGKAAALASVARSVSTQFERASALEQRIDLAREIHDDVIQRLFGVSMALDGEGDLPAAARERCAAETQTALSDLRSALQRPLGRAPRATSTTVLAEIARLQHVHSDLELRLDAGADVSVPSELEPLAQSVLTEAVRNAAKHAKPTRVSVRLGREGGAFSMEILNDGVDSEVHGRARAGMGLRLAALEALGVGGVIEFGEREPGSWQVRLVVPIPDEEEPNGG
ncbi:MAG TPA: GAF domain-containing protein [Solirubrobacteraceae bacterium]|nr:GAF domain-containing protein [Solirubrobacteraceae bacterium]